MTLPLAAPGVVAGAALVFLTCAKELPVTLMLRPTGADTLATRLWSHTGAGAFAAAAPYAVALRAGGRGAHDRCSTGPLARDELAVTRAVAA